MDFYEAVEMLRAEEFTKRDFSTTEKLVLRPAENAIELDENAAVLEKLQEIVGDVYLIAMSEKKLRLRHAYKFLNLNFKLGIKPVTTFVATGLYLPKFTQAKIWYELCVKSSHSSRLSDISFSPSGTACPKSESISFELVKPFLRVHYRHF